MASNSDNSKSRRRSTTARASSSKSAAATRSKRSGKAVQRNTGGKAGAPAGTLGFAVSSPLPEVVVPTIRTKKEAKRRLAEAEAQVVEALPSQQVKDLAVQAEQAAVALNTGTTPQRSVLTGEELPSAAVLKTMMFSNLQRGFAERREIVEQAFSVGEVAELLSRGRQYPHDRRKAGSLVAIKDGGKWFFPIWQFDPDGPDGALRGLSDVISALRGPLNDLTRVRWFTTPKRLLGGRTPVEALTAGDVDEVITEAESVGAS